MSGQGTKGGETVQELALAYFRNPRDYFWRWADNGAVVEWRTGSTLCYREELAHMLRHLAEQGLPPLAAVLLLLGGCAEAWGQDGEGGQLLNQMISSLPTGPDDPREVELGWQIRHAWQFLDVVRALPASLRTGEAKRHLFREVFAAQAPQVSAALAGSVLDEWESGRSEGVLHFSREPASRRVLLQELAVLARAHMRFPDAEALALHLRTGLDQLPKPLPDLPPAPAADAPAADAPAPEATDLLDQLAADARTAGLARLARQLGAALRIPPHARGAGEQPLGGVSDITNRGNFDRLLLSELAHDDLTLLARLVNSEALYLRREEPPRPEPHPRLILLDTTLRMWGVPRVFALAAALAWARGARQARPPAPAVAVGLGGNAFSALDLDSFEGVVAALALLDAAQHGGVALQAFARAAQTQAPADAVLITEAGLLHQPEFARALAEASPALRFLLTVDRSGELQLYEYQHGHRALISTAHYDLAALLSAAGPRRPQQRPLANGEPAFWQFEPAPLLLPAAGVRMSARNTFYQPQVGLLTVNEARRVLFWNDHNLGARELLPGLEAGTYCFGTDEQRKVFVLVSGRALLKVYAFSPDKEPVITDLAAELQPDETPGEVVFRDQCYYVRLAEYVLVFDCMQWRVNNSWKLDAPPAPPAGRRPDFSRLKRYVNNGYNVLQRAGRLEVNGLGELVIEGHELRLISHSAKLGSGLHLMSIAASTHLMPRTKAAVVATLPLPANPLVLLRHFRWPDGSTSSVDARGLLHLRSADATVPEITVLLVMGKPTAAWAADGTVCGPDYFTGPHPARRLAPADFQQQYLQRFIAPLG